MLYRFHVLRCFSDDPTHCGVIEADHIEKACRRFIAWNREHWEHEEFPLQGEPAVDVRGEDYATVTCASSWAAFPEDRSTGQDVYVIQPVEGRVFSLFAADWRATFTS